MLDVFLVFLGGASYALAGYLKNAAKERFSPEKILRTMILAGMVSAANYLMNGAGEPFTTGIAGTAMLEYLTKAMYRFAEKRRIIS